MVIAVLCLRDKAKTFHAEANCARASSKGDMVVSSEQQSLAKGLRPCKKCWQFQGYVTN